jgi:hypothetical protein
MLPILFYDFLFVFFLALILTGIFAIGFRRHRDKSVVGAFFVLLFLTTWAAGIWIVPVGNPWGTVPWLSFLVAGILLAFLLAAVIPFARPLRKSESKASIEETEEAVAAIIAFDIFFWVLIFVLIGVILAYYI